LLMNHYPLLHGYGCPPSQQPVPDAPQFHHHSPFNMTHNTCQPITCVRQYYASYGPWWQHYDLHPGGYGKSQMLSQQLCQGKGPSSSYAPREPTGLPGNNPVNQRIQSSCTLPLGRPCGTPRRLHNTIPTK
jgi:hypothetical protein